MFDLTLAAEQREFRDTVRDFVEREIKPVVLNPDRLQDPHRALPLALVDMAAQMGLRTLALSEAAGGAGADQLTCCIVLEELAAGDAGIATTLAQTSLAGRLIFDRMASAAQRARFLPGFVSRDRYHLAVALGETHPETDWNYHRPREEADTAIKAVRRGEEWVLSGAASFVPNAPVAQLFAVRATTESGMIAVLVPRDTRGLTVSGIAGEVEGRPALNWFHGVAGRLALDAGRVPVDFVLGESAAAIFARDGPYRQRDLVQSAAINLGVGRAAYEAALDYTKLRRQGGREIVEHQAIGTMLAEMAIRLEAARNMIWKAAWVLDHPETREDGSAGLPLAVMTKVFVSEAVHEVTERAAECFGAMGVMLDMPLPKYVQDALVFIHSGTSNSVAKFKVAEALAGYRRPSK